MLDGVVGVRASTGLGTVSAVVRGDVLSKDDVAGARCLGRGCNDLFFLKNLNRSLVKIGHHSCGKTAQENRNNRKGYTTRGMVHAFRTLGTVYETLAFWTESILGHF